ncbi:unnamed protein product [Angiostrongylus costaricensis]|uniref:SEC7 domain-containing protein n=1 Tax=Angiostrongylus costaricensis TaxID=334426 RepID=A0A3P7K528_ANGCS|nr:unnamed protein product [Angiostrongylus costaricensis]
MAGQQHWAGYIGRPLRVIIKARYAFSHLRRCLMRSNVLEKRYGGRARAHRAAIVIQRTYREYRLNRRWREMTLPTQRGLFLFSDCLMSPRLVQRRFPVPDRSPFSVTHVPSPSALKSVCELFLLPSHHIFKRKRQYRIALNFFNKKPERGVQLLTAWRFVDDSAESLANLLFGRRGLSKQMIGEYISTLHSTFHACVLKYFIGLIDVRGMEVDVALRKAMQYFLLPKEVEKIDKVIQEFAQHYAKCNPKEIKRFRGGWDTIHMIAFAVIMLNTDLHSPNLKSSQRMQMEQFIHNLRGQDKIRGEKDGADIDRACLQGIYERIRVHEIRPGDDHVAQVARVDAAFVGRDKPRLTETQRRLVCYCRLQQVLDPLRKQSAGSHERDVFLFNDMLVAINKRRSSSRTSYTLKHWMPLLGASVHEFKSNSYEFGLTITPPAPDSNPLHFNARNYDDRCRFVADVVESIRESCQMEEVRLELEMERHSLRNDNQRDSGLPELDGTDSLFTRPGNSVLSCPGLMPTFRRLSFNSLDSGVVEEACETNS